MNKNCPSSPTNKKEYISDLGKILVKNYGKKKYYKPEEIKKSHQKSKWYDFDFACWGMSAFSSQMDFINYHREIGEDCNYIAMKAEMFEGLHITTGSDLFENFNPKENEELDLNPPSAKNNTTSCDNDYNALDFISDLFFDDDN